MNGNLELDHIARARYLYLEIVKSFPIIYRLIFYLTTIIKRKNLPTTTKMLIESKGENTWEREIRERERERERPKHQE